MRNRHTIHGIKFGTERRDALHIPDDFSTYRSGHFKRLDSEAKIEGGLEAEEVEDRIRDVGVLFSICRFSRDTEIIKVMATCECLKIAIAQHIPRTLMNLRAKES